MMLAVFALYSIVLMICIAVFGYAVAQLFSEICHASKKQSPTTPDGGRSRPGPVWEVNQDWDGSEETGRDGEEA